MPKRLAKVARIFRLGQDLWVFTEQDVTEGVVVEATASEVRYVDPHAWERAMRDPRGLDVKALLAVARATRHEMVQLRGYDTLYDGDVRELALEVVRALFRSTRLTCSATKITRRAVDRLRTAGPSAALRAS
jgi:hypothetical protein